MRRRPTVLHTATVLGLAATALAVPSAGVADGAAGVTPRAATDPAFSIGTALSSRGFGGFAENYPGRDADHLRDALGEPASANESAYGCVMRWPAIGVRVELGTYGLVDDACADGFFSSARLTGPRWSTRSGVHVGLASSTARREAVRRRGRALRSSYPGARGYVLGRHRSECAQGLFPRVVAETRGGRVSVLHVLTSGCE